MSKRTVACVLVTNPKVLDWLGHMPILNWCLVRLFEVRGLDRIVVLASPKLIARVKTLLHGIESDVEIVEIPQRLLRTKGGDIRAWVCEENRRTASVVAFFNPITPFLPAAKIEACIEHVASGDYLAAFPARNTQVVYRDAGGKFVQDERPGLVNSLIVHVIDAAATWSTKFCTVPIGAIAAVDVTDPDGRALAEAMVSSGTNV